MPSTYSDCYQFQKAPSGIIATNYLGNIFRLAGSALAGANALLCNAASLTVQLLQYDTLTIFDGLNSEQVTVAAPTSPGSISIPLSTPTQFPHAAGTPVCSDGTAGSLAEQILTASAWIEDICHQSLWLSTYTGEILSFPTMRAALDRQGILWFRPRHFPFGTLSALSIQTTAQTSVAYDPTQAIVDSDRQLVQMPTLQPVSGGGSQSQVPYQQPVPGISRNSKGSLVLTYSSGYASLPFPVLRACHLLTAECFTQLENPIGADTIQQGKRNVAFTLRGDLTGHSLLVKQATKLLQPYVTEES